MLKESSGAMAGCDLGTGEPSLILWGQVLAMCICNGSKMPIKHLQLLDFFSQFYATLTVDWHILNASFVQPGVAQAEVWWAHIWTHLVHTQTHIWAGFCIFCYTTACFTLSPPAFPEPSPRGKIPAGFPASFTFQIIQEEHNRPSPAFLPFLLPRSFIAFIKDEHS